MNGFELMLIFNIWSLPILKGDLPLGWTTTFNSGHPDSVRLNDVKYAFLNDSVIRVTEVDTFNSYSDIQPRKSEYYWSLDSSKRISYRSARQRRDTAAALFEAYNYEKGFLVEKVRFQAGVVTGRERFEYKDGMLIKRIASSPGSRDTTQTEYSYEDGNIVNLIESRNGETSFLTTVQYGDRQVYITRGKPGGPAYEYSRLFTYEAGKLVESKQHIMGEMVSVTDYHYSHAAPVILKKRIDPVRSDLRLVDPLGRLPKGINRVRNRIQLPL
jgi:hypothetical protein